MGYLANTPANPREHLDDSDRKEFILSGLIALAGGKMTVNIYDLDEAIEKYRQDNITTMTMKMESLSNVELELVPGLPEGARLDVLYLDYLEPKIGGIDSNGL